MGRKKKDVPPLSDDPDRRSLELKLRARANELQYLGLTTKELIKLAEETRELAMLWQYDCARTRTSKGSSVACQLAESAQGHIEWDENRLAAKDDNNRSNIREIKITYQEPDPKIVEKHGAGNDDEKDHAASSKG